MPSTTVSMITVDKLTPYGFAANGAYVNYSKQFNEADKARVVPGASFEAELYIADSGKQYLNKILSAGSSAAPTSPVTVAAIAPGAKPAFNAPKKFVPKFAKKDDGMSKEEWAAKDLRISRQGVIQAAVQALAPVVGLDSLAEEAVKLADKMLAYVNPK